MKFILGLIIGICAGGYTVHLFGAPRPHSLWSPVAQITYVDASGSRTATPIVTSLAISDRVYMTVQTGGIACRNNEAK